MISMLISRVSDPCRHSDFLLRRHEAIADCTLGLARCSVPAPTLPASESLSERAIHSSPALALVSSSASNKSKAAHIDSTAYTRADLLLLRAKALVAVERFGLALYGTCRAPRFPG
jgi:hypothetical protein